MSKYLTDPGIRASAATGVIIATLAAVVGRNAAVWITLGIAWAVLTVVAVAFAHRKAAN